ncbi:unnamed protein product [Candidula unifasciata]|uniref:tRNA (guanine(26)-N(2))-dimethyltransferase n=1 Tax=Candidula unifasciata TaxID=100452 RepID=A0A8S3YYK5_9EUPU|nr:unnamed protein product [Candidula unifasciata]
MDVDETTKTVTELGVCIEDFTGDKPKTKMKCYNSKLKIFREFILATVSALVEIKSNHVYAKTDKERLSQSQVYALDALACTGVAGIQWKKHLSSHVHVTLADHDDTDKMVANAQANFLSCTEHKLNPLRVSGELVGLQGEKEVHYIQAEAKAVLMMEQYNFIYLSSNKNCASYFEPALHSMTSDGILCVIVPDISLFARTPHVVQRFFAADVVKTEYLKELAARIVLASLARAAARCLKGISPQYVVSHEDHLLICVKVSRGHNAADSSLKEIEKLLHCRLCEERVFMPNQLAPHEDPYSLLPCTCKKNNPGKTAVILGPAWKGHISDPDFLSRLQRQAKPLSLSTKFVEIASMLIKESLCAKSDTIRPVGFNSRPDLSSTEKDSNNCNSEAEHVNVHTSTSADAAENQSDSTSEAGPTDKLATPDHVEETLEASNGEVHAKEDVQEQTDVDSERQKRKAEDDVNKMKSKRQRKADVTKSTNVAFYYNVTKFRKTNLPKLDKLVTILHCRGHRASRTHFDSCAIRTSATVDEFLHIFG